METKIKVKKVNKKKAKTNYESLCNNEAYILKS
jgi:hypothetical protein